MYLDTSLVMKDKSVAGEDMAAIMGRCDRREWWLWSSAIAVTILLALGVGSFALPAADLGTDADSVFSLDQTVRSLLALVLLFDLYVIYEQVRVGNVRRDFAGRLYKLAVADSLTGLFNRRYIEHQLLTEIAHCRRRSVPLTVLLFDLDSFKQVNDEYGHDVGDDMLKAFAEQLQKSTRGSDLVARYGGDEFLVLLPDCETDGAESVLGRLNSNLVQKAKSALHLRYSAGCATYQLDESLSEFLKRADKSLYANKLQRRASRETSAGIAEIQPGKNAKAHRPIDAVSE
jgi:diguanylate cyclase (GGDEF)-like protein